MFLMEMLQADVCNVCIFPTLSHLKRTQRCPKDSEDDGSSLRPPSLRRLLRLVPSQPVNRQGINNRTYFSSRSAGAQS